MVRRLSPEESALWRKVIESVRPLDVGSTPESEPPPPQPAASPPVKARRVVPSPVKAKEPGTTLDGSWDRRLGRGLVQPDLAVDLHGHNLATAYDLLDRKLGQAIVMDARLVLLITGKPPADRSSKRGAIRAAVGDWLHASRHAGDIAAVRNAHPRHGGAGALYIVLRRRRERP
jgi:DNA-nicking Smr family endonuclease